MATELSIARGSDKTLPITWLDADDNPLDFTGMTLSFFDVSFALQDKITGSIVTPAAGAISVHIEGSDPLPVGLHSFRLRLSSSGGETLTSKPINLRIE